MFLAIFIPTAFDYYEAKNLMDERKYFFILKITILMNAKCLHVLCDVLINRSFLFLRQNKLKKIANQNHGNFSKWIEKIVWK